MSMRPQIINGSVIERRGGKHVAVSALTVAETTGVTDPLSCSEVQGYFPAPCLYGGGPTVGLWKRQVQRRGTAFSGTPAAVLRESI